MIFNKFVTSKAVIDVITFSEDIINVITRENLCNMLKKYKDIYMFFKRLLLNC